MPSIANQFHVAIKTNHLDATLRVYMEVLGLHRRVAVFQGTYTGLTPRPKRGSYPAVDTGSTSTVQALATKFHKDTR
jgi:hypothetical protein